MGCVVATLGFSCGMWNPSVPTLESKFSMLRLRRVGNYKTTVIIGIVNILTEVFKAC